MGINKKMERKMKDSWIKWIWDIPENRSLKPLQFCLKEKNNKNIPVKTKQVLSLVKDKGVMLYEEKWDQWNKAKDDVSQYKLAYPNTLIVNSMNILIGSVWISKYFWCVSPVYYVFEETNESDLRFINYIFNTKEFQKELRKYANGILEIRLRVSSYDIFKRKIALPSKIKQQKIADFLDKKCTEIDSLYADIEKQIEKLEDYKKSVITEAVTKWLNPDVEKKDSEIEYIWMIPKSWTLTRLKYNLKNQMKYWASESWVDYSEDLPRYIRITDITSDNKLKEDWKLSLTFEQAKGYILNEETILFARSWGTVGKTFLYKPSYWLSAFAWYLISAIPNKKKMRSKRLYYYTLSNAYWWWANMIFTQATIQNIWADKYSNLPITITNLNEQDDIIKYLDSKCWEIDSILDKKQKQLDLLEKYKKSIIYEYVTGKKEVPSN